MPQDTTVRWSGLPHAKNSHNQTTPQGGRAPALRRSTPISSTCSTPFDTTRDDSPASTSNWTCGTEGGFLDAGTTAQQELNDDGEASQHESAEPRTRTKTKRTTNTTAADRKRHDEIEKKYRDGINKRVEKLRDSLPLEAEEKLSKGQVLDRASEYIQLLEEKIQMAEEKTEEKTEEKAKKKVKKKMRTARKKMQMTEEKMKMVKEKMQMVKEKAAQENQHLRFGGDYPGVKD